MVAPSASHRVAPVGGSPRTPAEVEAWEIAVLNGNHPYLPAFLSPTDCRDCGGGNRYPCICGSLS